MNHSVVKVPATSANLGPGFDVIGVALKLYNEVRFDVSGGAWGSHRSHPTLRFEIHGGGAETLPQNETNLVVRAAYRVFEKAHRWPTQLRVVLVNRIPLSRGLGSSAAATVGGLCAANRLIGTPFNTAQLLQMAVAMEGHPDNVVPAMIGGFCVSTVLEREVKYFRVQAPGSLQAVVCSPDKPLATSEARRVLPGRVPLKAAVFTSSHVAFLLGAIIQRRYDWLSFAMDDVLHQPVRARLVPGFRDVIREAKQCGAWGCALSGAGSTMIAFARPGAPAKRVGQAMQRAFAAHKQKSHWMDLGFDNKGVKVS